MRIVTARSKRYINKYIKIILENKLYADKYSGFYIAIKNKNNIEKISLLKDKDIYVGSFIKTKKTIMHGCNVGVYIIPSKRRYGLGTRLFNHCIRNEQWYNYQVTDKIKVKE